MTKYAPDGSIMINGMSGGSRSTGLGVKPRKVLGRALKKVTAVAKTAANAAGEAIGKPFARYNKTIIVKK